MNAYHFNIQMDLFDSLVHPGFVRQTLSQILLDKIPFLHSISGFPTKGGIQVSALPLSTLTPDTRHLTPFHTNPRRPDSFSKTMKAQGAKYEFDVFMEEGGILLSFPIIWHTIEENHVKNRKENR